MRNRFFTLIAVAGLVLVSCSGDDDSSVVESTPESAVAEQVEVTEPAMTEPEVTEPATTEPATTEPDVTEPEVTEPEVTEPAETEPEATEPATTAADALEPDFALGLTGCEQVAIYLPVDVAQTEGRVPENAELVVEDGRATALFLVMECEDSTVDGISTGASHVVAEWLSVTGPDEVREFAESPDIQVTPTQYWEPVLYQTDNATLQELSAAAGFEMTLVDEVTFTPYTEVLTDDGTYQGQSGTVTASDGSQYIWAVGAFASSTTPVVDVPTVFVHVAGDIELEVLGHVRVAAVPNSILVPAEGADEPIGNIPGQPGEGYVVTYDELTITPTT
jgi:hypothetical protein